MKKICCLLVLPFVFMFLLTGCSNTFSLVPFVSELKSQLYYGESDGFKLKASYGFKETPFINDGKIGQIVKSLTFKLLDRADDNITYSLETLINGKEYKSDFKYNPVSDTLYLSFEIDDFEQNTFSANLCFADNKIPINFISQIPENTLTFEEVTKIIVKEQPTLINSFKSDNSFNAELYLRIIVKNSHPYWYVGLASGNEKLKAFLVDGISGEILAIREIF